MSDVITLWRNKPSTDMTREELLEALEVAVKALTEERSRHMASLDMLRMVSEVKTP